MASVNNTARLVSAAATTNSTKISGQAVTVRRLSGYNASAGAVYLKLYDKGSAAPVVGTDAPRKTIYLPTLTAFCLDQDDYFGSGLGFALTGGSADSDTTAVAAGDILGLNIDYHDA